MMLRRFPAIPLFLCCVLAIAPVPAQAPVDLPAGTNPENSPVSQTLPVQEALPIPTSPPPKIWLRAVQVEAPGAAFLRARFPEVQPVTDPVVFECEMRGRRDLGSIFAHLEVYDAARALVYRGDLELHVAEEITPFQFTWNASEIPDGNYTIRFFIEKSVGFPIASAHVSATKLSPENVVKRILDARAALNAIHEYLPHSPGLSHYYTARLAIAHLFLPQPVLSESDWRVPFHLANYALRTSDAVRARLTFGDKFPALAHSHPVPSLAHLDVAADDFTAAGAEVYLAGVAAPHEVLTSNVVHDVESLGLRLISIEDTTAAAPSDLDPLFRAAEQHNLSVAYIHTPPPRVLPPSLDEVPEDYSLQRAAAESRERLRPLLEYFSTEPMLGAVILESNPKFMFSGESVRDSFIRWIADRYRDRNTLNRNWRTRFASFDEVPIWWNLDRPSYQFDWQTYHRILVTRHFEDLSHYARSSAPGIPIGVAPQADFFERNESRYGIDRAALSDIFDFAAISIQGRETDPRYAQAYPHETLHIALARSHNPRKPIFLIENLELRPDEYFNADLGRYTHSLVWNALVEGADAVAVRGTVGPQASQFDELSLLNQPEALEGFSRAALDATRLGHLIAAFQDAPAVMGILLVNSSKIYSGGDPHLESAVRAYEGTSFSGLKVRFLTEAQLEQNETSDIKVLVIPETPAITNRAFAYLQALVDSGITVVRSSTQFSYDELGRSRLDSIVYPINAFLVRGENASTEFLHALDAAIAKERTPPMPRATNPHGYTLEGVITRSVDVDGALHVYLNNLRKEPILCYLADAPAHGTDLISGRNIRFPLIVNPLQPMLIRTIPEPLPEDFVLDELEPMPVPGIPTAEVTPIPPPPQE